MGVPLAFLIGGTSILHDQGYPPSRYQVRMGVPHPRSGKGELPSQVRAGGTLTWEGSTPSPIQTCQGDTHPVQTWEGGNPCPDLGREYSLSRPGKGYPPIQTWEGDTPPSRLGMAVLPSQVWSQDGRYHNWK